MRIGFIGAGMMGEGMVANLMKRGHELWLIAHRNRAPIDVLVGKGAHEAATLKMLAQNCELIIFCMSTGKVVEGTQAPDRKVLVGQFGPVEIPFVVRRVGTGWRVDAEPYFSLMMQ